MGTRGTDPFVEQVRAATDILAVISGYVELRKAGARHKALCPFHTEKAPSFFVNVESQTYYCFGCQKGGDVFSFLMEQEKLTFPEALRMLAEKAGIPMPQRRRRGEEGIDNRLGEAMEVAAAFYCERLKKADGKGALDYLAGRGITRDSIERFGMGWAPASWDGLLNHARRLLPERVLLKAGLLIEGDRGPYDRFRGRIMIPIRSAGGRTVAFGGRLLAEGEPKYMNSPETPLYKKGTTLFGLQEARNAIRDERNVLVVEGYFDVIALSEAGLGWAVGTCGTALTGEQAALLRRYTENWTLLFDGDQAGRTAVLRAFDAVIPVHPAVRIALCPEGLDPDSWVRRDGPEVVQEALTRAQTPLQYLEGWARSAGLSTEATIPKVAALLRRVTDPMIRDLWVQEAAGRFRVRERTLWAAIGPAKQSNGKRSDRTAGSGGSDFSAREQQIIAAAVRDPREAAALLEACQDVPGITLHCREILSWVSARNDEGISEEAGLLSRAVEEGDQLMRDLSFLHQEVGQMKEVPSDLIDRLRGFGLRQRMRDLTDRIRRAEEEGQDLAPLLKEKQDLALRLRGLDLTEKPAEGNFS